MTREAEARIRAARWRWFSTDEVSEMYGALSSRAARLAASGDPDWWLERYDGLLFELEVVLGDRAGVPIVTHSPIPA